ncbi:MAG: hypothetical protein AABY10_03385, partial [Nanoarchaeota archaeon]
AKTRENALEEAKKQTSVLEEKTLEIDGTKSPVNLLGLTDVTNCEICRESNCKNCKYSLI